MTEPVLMNSTNPNIQEQPKYYACEDPNRPICRQYVNQGHCRRNNRCNFYHPKVMTRLIEKKAKREPGHCYCGSFQKTIIGNTTYRLEDGINASKPTFFVVCSRTGKSMRKCM